jgi:uncharacterized protein (DUF433 family)
MVHDRIVRNPKIMSGQPVVAGTRIPAATILNDLATGSTEQEILEDYPSLTLQDIRAVLAFASAVLNADRSVAAE